MTLDSGATPGLLATSLNGRVGLSSQCSSVVNWDTEPARVDGGHGADLQAVAGHESEERSMSNGRFRFRVRLGNVVGSS